MSERVFPRCVLFGGSGFIGTHLAGHLLASGKAEEVWLADFRPTAMTTWPRQLQEAQIRGRVHCVTIDVRRSIVHADLPQHVDLIVNLAAVHREPGHEPEEYFATNLPGAENICTWAEGIGCQTIIFTSSIAPYGPTEEEKDETSLPVPISPYGASKLVAEKIHLSWQRAEQGRQLLIVRPGVVFGPGEGGNVTRMIRAVCGRYFFYMGNRQTRKAGGYVKELCYALTWMLQWQQNNNVLMALFNFSMDPAPTMEEYVQAICCVANIQRFVPNIPYPLLLSLSYPIEALSRPLAIHQPINPVRIRKLIRSTNVIPRFLRSHGYSYQYTLEQALRDWLQERPEEWR
ncbi:MAG: NAD-dependent epimerase/dehydratase family protein [Candidatus Binatia bacterium]